MAKPVVILFFLIAGLISLTKSEINHRVFPLNFRFGASTASYQIEGGWNEDGKGPSMWDEFVHENPDIIKGEATGDVACDSYHQYEKDVGLLVELGAQFYRFSISWPRILPNGTSHNINQKGVDYYLNLLKLLKENDIEPIVTLYHWDLPLSLKQMGGWTNPDIANYYGDYARLCFELFGQYVKYWVTLNEPQSSCIMAYGGGSTYVPLAPNYHLPAEGFYLCAYTHLKAHALAYHIYQDEFKKEQQGKLSIAFVNQWFEPASNNSQDLEAQELALQFSLGLFAHPIYVGNWPQLVIDRVGNRSAIEGLPKSRLPSFTQEEIDYIRGTYDWFGVNYYMTYLVSLEYREDDLPGNASFIVDQGFSTSFDPSWKVSNSSSWISQVPWGLTNSLRFIRDNYKPPEIIITENGWSEDGHTLNDTDRIEYVQLHLSSVLDAIYKYDINVLGYTQWSLMDNFEWADGYSSKLGMVSVNFTSEERTRTPKQSFYWYRCIIENRALTVECNDADWVFSNLSLWKLALSLAVSIAYKKMF